MLAREIENKVRLHLGVRELPPLIEPKAGKVALTVDENSVVANATKAAKAQSKE